MKNLILIALFASTGIYAQSTCFDDGPNGPEQGILMYRDNDKDGWGSDIQDCTFSSTDKSYYSNRTGDCNDNNAAIKPRRFYLDNDGDGFGSSKSKFFCQYTTPIPIHYTNNSEDCDDTTAAITNSKKWYADSDGDSFGDDATVINACIPPSTMANPVSIGGDFNDANALITNIAPNTFYYDGDNDGYGIDNNSVYQSIAPDHYVTQSGDCDDADKQFNPQTVWFYDFDNDGLGNPAKYVVQCLKPTINNGRYVLNSNDLCPKVAGTTENNGCETKEVILPKKEDRNYEWSASYRVDKSITSNGITYFNEQGKQEQTQSVDIKTGKTWASQTLYDTQGKPAISTLSAPIGSPVSFEYKTDFIKNASNVDFSSIDFEANPENPNTVSDQEGTLGHYYSNKNTSEPYQDITNRPYSRTLYSKLNPGQALKTVGGNKVDTNGDGNLDGWVHGYSFTMRASQELSTNAAFGEVSENDYDSFKITKTVSRDVKGNEVIVFTDTDGKTLASARSGDENITPRSNSIEIGSQGYVDIHIPKGIQGITISHPNYVDAINLITEEDAGNNYGALPSGFYRIVVEDLDAYNNSGQTYTVTYKENYYNYALNYYDQVGRLIKSTQPLSKDLVTEYKYNTLGQLIYTKSPDEGEAWFKYRKDGQIRFSTNSMQTQGDPFSNVSSGKCSYTDYDDKGRPVESGVVHALFYYLVADGSKTDNYPTSEVTKTQYDFLTEGQLDGYSELGLPTPRFLAGNVARIANDMGIIDYSYDIYGRVEWVLQYINGFGHKTIHYTYDSITGQVTDVIYQKNKNDEFKHRYTYNDTGQLIKVETAARNATYITQAEYEYYETGGLKRTELADGKQGIDYVYNLAGQLKAINHPELGSGKDPNGDINDLFGMQIDYHSGDYLRQGTNIASTSYGDDQLNGNIKSIRWNNVVDQNNTQNSYTYTYNKNNWLTGAEFGTYSATSTTGVDSVENDNNTYTASSGAIIVNATQSITLTNGFHAKAGSNYHAYITQEQGYVSASDDYKVSDITYDANGNILNLKRNKKAQNGISAAMDDLWYKYDSNKPNQLKQVIDMEGASTGKDIGTQGINNYEYNSIGQLTRNNDENINYFYNTSGLVTEVQKDNKTRVKFFYNANGHRVKKETYNGNSIKMYSTYYVRDASGQVMAIYNEPAGSTATTVATEYAVYGSGRIGVYKPGSIPKTLYELTDHLGNVRTVFSVEDNANATLSNEAYTDYYPFGMPMPGRNIVGDYRYAFQGQEKDSETGKEAFQLRLWDSRIARWLTTDPYGQYASPYLGMGNNPMNGIDPDGGKFNDEWEVGADGGLTWLSNKGGDNVQYFHFSEGHEFSGQTAIATGNFNSGLNFVDVFNTADVLNPSTYFDNWDGNAVRNFYEFGARNYHQIQQSNGGGISLQHPVTGDFIPTGMGRIEENNIFFDILTLGGAAKSIYNIFRSVPKNGRILGGASKNVSYFTDKAVRLGHSTALTGASVKAGVFVQIHHNVGRILGGRGISILRSNSAASIVGREMLNNAYKTGGLQLFIGGASTINDFRN